jgi:hypothetical protein
MPNAVGFIFKKFSKYGLHAVAELLEALCYKLEEPGFDPQ